MTPLGRLLYITQKRNMRYTYIKYNILKYWLPWVVNCILHKEKCKFMSPTILLLVCFLYFLHKSEMWTWFLMFFQIHQKWLFLFVNCWLICDGLMNARLLLTGRTFSCGYYDTDCRYNRFSFIFLKEQMLFRRSIILTLEYCF